MDHGRLVECSSDRLKFSRLPAECLPTLPPLQLLPMSHSISSSDDKEKGYVAGIDIDQAAPDESAIVDRFARYGKVGSVIRFMLASGVEARGVERVPEDQRETKNMWNKCVRTPRHVRMSLNYCPTAS